MRRARARATVVTTMAAPTLLALLTTLALAQASTPWRQFAAPEEAGFSSEALAGAWEAADRAGSAAVFVVVRGNVLVAWGEVARRFETHSVRKSLMNALIGIAVERGALRLDATLAELGIDDLQPLSAAEKGARLADLLAARSGVYHPSAKEPADMRAERPARGSQAPGASFFYNNWDFNVLGTLFERATGRTVAAAFQEWIAAPLGMEDFRPEDVFPELAPSYSIHPAHAFRVSARDLARFGELYLRKGSWHGHAVVPASWVARSTTPVTDFGDGSGYGFLWWIYRAGALAGYPTLNAHDLHLARGTGGQVILVVPDAELVFVHRADTDAEREVRGRDVWGLAERILAARSGAPAAEPALRSVAVEPFSDPAPPHPDHRAVPLDQAAIAGLTGEYALPGMSVRVFEHAGRLFAHRSDGDEAELLPLSAERYFLFTTSYEVEFERDAAGRAGKVRLLTPRGTLEGTRREDG